MIRTATDIIQGLADHPESRLTEFDRRGRRVVSRSYPELHDRARAIAACMRATGVQTRDVVFLQLPNGCDLVEHFLAALLLDALPCCLAPPRALGGLEAYRARMAQLAGAFPGSHLIATEDTGSRSGQDYVEPFDSLDGMQRVDPAKVPADSIAFLQLTSGTSRTPKAVKISHAALCSNTLGILHGGDAQPGDAYVSWLPLYHDMGLVGMLFCALANGSSLDLFRPDTFAARPLTWLKALSDLDGTGVTTAPNFAYQHCVNTIPAEAAAELDLSRWRVAGCGAERVRPETLLSFTERFAPAGFAPESFVPCYGMAEATLAVTFDRSDRPPRVVDDQVSCGRPLRETEVVIRDPQGHPVPPGTTGEITVRGPGLCSGYTADVDTDSIRDGWLFTGDRGMLRNGELFVTGRLKDLIIIDGQNVDPSEIEAIAEAVVQTSGGRSAAFPTEIDAREQVVLVVETAAKQSKHFRDWADRIGSGVASLFGFRLHDLVFVARGELPTTSSGKVRRSEVRTLYDLAQLARLPDG